MIMLFDEESIAILVFLRSLPAKRLISPGSRAALRKSLGVYKRPIRRYYKRKMVVQGVHQA